MDDTAWNATQTECCHIYGYHTTVTCVCTTKEVINLFYSLKYVKPS